MMYNRSEIMKRAWEIKKDNVKKFGKKPNSYTGIFWRSFGDCLKRAWEEAKKEVKMSETRKANAERQAEEQSEQEAAQNEIVYIIPGWLAYEKEIFGIEPTNVRRSAIERETAKAFKAYGVWFPKSQCQKVA